MSPRFASHAYIFTGWFVGIVSCSEYLQYEENVKRWVKQIKQRCQKPLYLCIIDQILVKTTALNYHSVLYICLLFLNLVKIKILNPITCSWFLSFSVLCSSNPLPALLTFLPLSNNVLQFYTVTLKGAIWCGDWLLLHQQDTKLTLSKTHVSDIALLAQAILVKMNNQKHCTLIDQGFCL